MAAEVILSSRWEIETMAIGDVLISQRDWGARRCRGFLAGLGLREEKTVGSMTGRQRIAAAAVLARGAPLPETTTQHPFDASGTPTRDGARADSAD